MNYKKGQFLTYIFPTRIIEEIKNNKIVKNLEKSGVIKSFHRVVVLHTRTTPFRTILVAPVTSSKGLKSKNDIPDNYVELKSRDYPGVLDNDSFINLDMIMPIDEYELTQLERYSKKIEAYLEVSDLYKMDYKIALTYELQDYFAVELNKEIRQEFETVIEYIDSSIKEKVNLIIKKIRDPEIEKLLEEIIENDLIGVIKSQYLEKK
jgi:hypothetical protein